MYTYEENQKILERYSKKAVESRDISAPSSDDELGINEDGVYYKGQPYSRKQDVSTGKWYSERYHGTEDEQWNNASRRILFITKDSGDSGNPYDMRCMDITHRLDRDELAFKGRFINNMLRINAGLNALSLDGYPCYEIVNDISFCHNAWESSAVARINLKKYSGGPQCPNPLLRQAMDNYRGLLIEQIKLIDANIIVCCGGSSIIKNFVVNNIYKDADNKFGNNWIYYSPSHKVWIIDSYHLNPRGAITDEDLYLILR